jgi:hypothetical protein
VLRDVGGYAPCLVAGEQLGRRTSFFPQLAQMEGGKTVQLVLRSSRTSMPFVLQRETRAVDNAQDQPQMLCDPRSLASLHFLDHAGAA